MTVSTWSGLPGAVTKHNATGENGRHAMGIRNALPPGSINICACALAARPPRAIGRWEMNTRGLGEDGCHRCVDVGYHRDDLVFGLAVVLQEVLGDGFAVLLHAVVFEALDPLVSARRRFMQTGRRLLSPDPGGAARGSIVLAGGGVG